MLFQHFEINSISQELFLKNSLKTAEIDMMN